MIDREGGDEGLDRLGGETGVAGVVPKGRVGVEGCLVERVLCS